MKYLRTSIAFQELPTEMALAIEITGCPRRCEGCHSPELQQDVGEDLSVSELKRIIDRYSHAGERLFSCILFMGGEQHYQFLPMLRTCRELGIDCGLYTGADNVSDEVKQHLKWLKTGSYNKELGGLGSPNTNQKLIKLTVGV